jgi:hypothetical protein
MIVLAVLSFSCGICAAAAVSQCSEHTPAEHLRARKIGREAMRSRDERTRRSADRRMPDVAPARGRRQRHLGRSRLEPPRGPRCAQR